MSSNFWLTSVTNGLTGLLAIITFVSDAVNLWKHSPKEVNSVDLSLRSGVIRPTRFPRRRKKKVAHVFYLLILFKWWIVHLIISRLNVSSFACNLVSAWSFGELFMNRHNRRWFIELLLTLQAPWVRENPLLTNSGANQFLWNQASSCDKDESLA